MTLFITAIVLSALGCGALFFISQHLLSKTTASAGSHKETLDEEIAEVTARVDELLKYKASFASKGQFQTLANKVKSFKDNLDKEREGLRQLEGSLDTAQTNVEEKEAAQQELKSAKEEDELKVEQLLADYQSFSDESIALEQRLAQSMKNLDAILAEVEFSDEQKEVMNGLSDSLSQAGETLRNLLTDYQSVNERLKMLGEQHEDLEEEYTKLVEQQLGE